MDEIEAIERATLDAMPPRRLVQRGDWLLPLDDGTVGRSHSAVPLRHVAPTPDMLTDLEQQYRAAGLPLVLRLPEVPAFEGWLALLRENGYTASKPTLVQTGPIASLSAARRVDAHLERVETPGPEWERVFLGEGFDPVDGASRLGILRRGTRSLFVGIRADGKTVAVGSACLSHGWCGIHGMRTLPAWRGRGFAGAILAALGEAAHERGLEQCFLQVEAANAAARSLYAARGLRTAWAYSYWKKP